MGDQDELRRSLLQFGAGKADWDDNTPTTALADHLRRRLQGRGYDVDLGYGQSTITTDLAVRRSGDEAFDLALFVDDEKHYDVGDLIERYVTRPQIFKAFGWQAEHVLALDWFHPQNRLLDRVDGYFETQTEMARPLLRVVE